MNCQDIEPLMADALGGELSAEDRVTFDAHLRDCTACREELESNRRTLSMMNQLPGPQRVNVHRDGDRLVIQDESSASRNPESTAPGKSLRAGMRTITAFRYAAGLLIAFTAGYAMHVGVTLTQPITPQPIRIARDGGPDDVAARQVNLRSTVRSIHARQPGRSTLVKALIAIGRARG